MVPKLINWSHQNPVHLIRSPFQELAKYINFPHVLLVTTHGFVKRGIVDLIRNSLKPRSVLVWDGVKPNPNIEDLDLAIKKFQGSNIDYVIGLGGGSAIDTAKILAATISNFEARSLKKILLENSSPMSIKKIPLMVIPTTSGTGAEVTPFATVWDHVERKKYSLSGSFLYPDIALFDPILTLSLEQNETLYSGLDAISHGLESLWNKHRTPISQIFSMQALKLANSALPAVMIDPTSLINREKMQTASTLAGIAISQTRTAIAHSISYPLTAHYNIPHGLACSFSLSRLITHYLQSKSESESEVINMMIVTRELLESFDLDNLISNFAGASKILNLQSQMLSPERANNFCVELPDIKNIVINQTY